jgi:uncharacterized membrane-anchored protein YhcB (DUF1043 family)
MADQETTERPQRQVLLMLLGCVSVLIVFMLLLGILGGGLSSPLKAQATAELQNLISARKQFDSARQEVETALADEPLLFENEAVDWRQRLQKSAESLDAASKTQKQLDALLAENDNDKREQVDIAIQQLAAARVGAWAEALQMQQEAKILIAFKRELPQRLPKIEEDLKAIQSQDLTAIKTLVEKASTDWPQKKNDVERRFKQYTEYQTEAVKGQKSITAARDGTGKHDIKGLLQLANRLDHMRTELSNAEKQMSGLIDELYWSWDRILADIEIQEGSLVTFRQKFLTHRIRALVPEGKEAEVKTTEETKTVTKSTYESMKDNLGMVVEHKPAGKYDHESTKVVQPVGYAYIAPVEQKTNRYGHWERRSGGSSFWVFYGQYSLMRNLLGMGSSRYSAVTPSMYRGYESNTRSGRAYYGRDEFGRNRYGSNGAVTKKSYASSKYVSTGGFKNSRYVKSGGTYSGSQYAPRPTSSRPSSSYRTSSVRSGSRSSGGK